MIYSLAHISAIQQTLIDAYKTEDKQLDVATQTVKELFNNPSLNSNYKLDLRENFIKANKLLPWTNSLEDQDSLSLRSWIIIHTFLSEEISNESLHRKFHNYMVMFTLKFRTVRKVTDFNPQKDEELLMTSHALREGYDVKGGKGRIKVLCPSGQVRYVSKDHCNCKTFNETLKMKKPCLHLTMAKVFLENRSVFED